MEKVKGVKNLKTYRQLDNIRQKGGLLEALKELEQVRPLAGWDDQQYDRLRKDTIKVAETPILTSVSPLVEELHRKMQELTSFTPLDAAA